MVVTSTLYSRCAPSFARFSCKWALPKCPPTSGWNLPFGTLIHSFSRNLTPPEMPTILSLSKNPQKLHRYPPTITNGSKLCTKWEGPGPLATGTTFKRPKPTRIYCERIRRQFPRKCCTNLPSNLEASNPPVTLVSTGSSVTKPWTRRICVNFIKWKDWWRITT